MELTGRKEYRVFKEKEDCKEYQELKALLVQWEQLGRKVLQELLERFEG